MTFRIVAVFQFQWRLGNVCNVMRRQYTGSRTRTHTRRATMSARRSATRAKLTRSVARSFVCRSRSVGTRFALRSTHVTHRARPRPCARAPRERARAAGGRANGRSARRTFFLTQRETGGREASRRREGARRVADGKEFSTAWLDGMSHKKWRETKQQLSRARSCHQIRCCLVSLHFLCDNSQL